MANLVLQEVRGSYLDSEGNPIFTIEATCTDAGDLSDTGLFLKQVVDPADPTQDILIRVANIADLETYSSNRITALQNGSIYWRDSQNVLEYDAIDVATEAVQALSDRINQLVNDYTTYIDQFKKTELYPEVLTFPTTDPDRLTAAEDAYSAAFELYDTALANAEQAQADVATAEANAAIAQTNMSEWANFQTSVTNNATEMATATNDFTSLSDSSLDSILATDGFLASMALTGSGSTAVMTKLHCADAGYVNLSSTDIGDEVAYSSGPADKGRLIGYDNDLRIWLIVPYSSGDTFSSTGNATVGGTLHGTLDRAGELLDLDVLLDDLQSARDTFFTAYNTAQTGISKAETGVTNHSTVASNVTSKATSKAGDYEVAKAEVNTASMAYQTATASVSLAYAALETAYNNVKALDPSWTPPSGEEFPPTP